MAIDFGEASLRALDGAIELASRFGASVAVMHAYQAPAVNLVPEGAVVSRLADGAEIAAAAQHTLDEAIAARSDRGVKLEAVLCRGPAWREIEAVADETGADLIVLGTSRHHGALGALLGSVSDKVVRTTRRPVLTIPAAHASRPAQRRDLAAGLQVGRASGCRSSPPAAGPSAPRLLRRVAAKLCETDGKREGLARPCGSHGRAGARNRRRSRLVRDAGRGSGQPGHRRAHDDVGAAGPRDPRARALRRGPHGRVDARDGRPAALRAHRPDPAGRPGRRRHGAQRSEHGDRRDPRGRVRLSHQARGLRAAHARRRARRPAQQAARGGQAAARRRRRRRGRSAVGSSSALARRCGAFTTPSRASSTAT